MAQRYKMPQSPLTGDLRPRQEWTNYFAGIEELAGPVGQVVFPATQNPSTDPNTLDDYEEGTWTPVLTFDTPGDLSVVYATQSGQYTKIGRLVVAQWNITTSAFTHTTASGNVLVGGLPFTAATVSKSPVVWSGVTKANYTDVIASSLPSSTDLAFNICGSGQAASTVQAADMPTGGTVILEGCVSYQEE